MIFNDQSGSMSGKPFDALKKACIDIADRIFDDNKFEQVHTVFYESNVHPFTCQHKNEFVTNILNSTSYGGTGFINCFNHIEKTLREAEIGSEFSIIFFTDGCAGDRIDQLQDK